VSTYGLDGVLSWPQARYVAGSAGRPLPGVLARLDEAGGAILSRPVETAQDDPPSDSAAVRGFAVCGEGPWLLTDPADVVTPGTAVQVERGQTLPRHTDAVLPVASAASSEDALGRVLILGRDDLTGIPDEQARPSLGSGIRRQASISKAGHILVPADSIVTPAVLSLAAAAGHDDIEIVRTPVVGVLVLGSALLDRGLPRKGRVRDALGQSVPAFIGALGGRGNPAVRAPDTEDLLLREIDDAAVDVLITTGSTAPDPDNHLRRVLRDLDARWLVDGVSATPGAQMVLARLQDGRFLVGLPGDPAAAMAALITLVTPLIGAMRGEPAPGRARSAVLMDDTPPADYADDTALIPVRLEVSAAAVQARPIPATGPAGLQGWATADAIAVVPPGAGLRGDVVEILDPYGRVG
jgi:molybdopterin molybdotransferase